MKILARFGISLVVALLAGLGYAQTIDLNAAPDPKDIPVPEIKTPMGNLPSVNELPVRKEMPDVMTMNDGTRVTTPEQWAARREEMKKILEYYAVGQAPPPPGNVTGKEIKSELLVKGTIKYRLIHLTFGPDESLSMDIGIFTPTQGGPFPAYIEPSGSPPGATTRPILPQGRGPGHEQDVLSMMGPTTRAATTRPGMGFGFRNFSAEEIAETNQAILHGFAYVTFNTNDCAEDTTLRNPDGSFAFRTTRFFPAYPGYDWGILRGWAWGESRIADYLQNDPSIDKNKLIITGVSRWGKAALIAGALDDRFAMVAPVASSGGGTPAYRFSGFGRGGKEGLVEMMRKYPNQFSPHLYQFYGHQDQLPFDENWFIALCAPRPFIALEGLSDQNVQHYGVRQSWINAKPAYDFLGVPDRLGISWTERRHGKVQGDWDALLAFADKYLMGKKVARRFDEFPPTAFIPPGQTTEPSNEPPSNAAPAR